MADIGKYFNGSTPDTHITFRTPDGTKLLELTAWAQDELNYKSGTAAWSTIAVPPTHRSTP